MGITEIIMIAHDGEHPVRSIQMGQDIDKRLQFIRRKIDHVTREQNDVRRTGIDLLDDSRDGFRRELERTDVQIGDLGYPVAVKG